ncbi:MAG: NAD-dependent epimerase/dehydratase family protein, partial [Desulfobacteraceae bacterium]|nr:NAD-dependent epimerase/dehydratase family protein [Desulfobacteraceae bacterium]
MNPDSKIFVAGPGGLVGSAIIRCLQKKGYLNILSPLHSELELMDTNAVNTWFDKHKPDYVYLAAAKVGGIMANSTYGADFIYQNLMIQNNIIHQSHVHKVKKLIFLGSSCIYPKHCPQPMKEEYLMTGKLEPTNSPYALAKIAGIEMCWAYN